ncbi:hypothetical protein RHMOL_Rhmol08G0097600 [Rhododendron molle]|uniref:Uncharacterized protein n=1 Tax=Rhododendron molle TaxID=49168 RepID=A0ACC0MMX2_RHOML|nr:hypothetical protein RHMOL_Rhmol08G0097600 [Rhododendron molle]
MGGRRGGLHKGHRKLRLETDDEEEVPRPKKQRTTEQHRQGNDQLLDEREDEEQASDVIVQAGEGSGDRSAFATLTDPEVLDCPICFEHLGLPVFQCQNGHLACSSCCSKLGNKCPSCSSLVGFYRCRGVEKILESVKIPCQNMKYGCKEMVFKCKRHDHEDNCIFAQGKRAGKEAVELEEDDPVEEKRRKVTARRESKARSLWKEKVLKKGVCCERQVDRHSLGDTEYITTIVNRGLSHFFRVIDGYYKPWVIEFYQNMYIDTAKREIEAYVQNKLVQITPDLVARYLGYTRPPLGSTTYPDPKRLAGVKQPAGFKLEPPHPGAFNNASEMKSKSLSKPPPQPQPQPPPPQAESSAPTAPPRKKRGFKSHVIGMLKSILCRQEDIMKEQKILNRKVDYVIARWEDQTQIRYDPNLNMELRAGGIGANESDGDGDEDANDDNDDNDSDDSGNGVRV